MSGSAEPHSWITMNHRNHGSSFDRPPDLGRGAVDEDWLAVKRELKGRKVWCGGELRAEGVVRRDRRVVADKTPGRPTLI